MTGDPTTEEGHRAHHYAAAASDAVLDVMVEQDLLPVYLLFVSAHLFAVVLEHLAEELGPQIGDEGDNYAGFRMVVDQFRAEVQRKRRQAAS